MFRASTRAPHPAMTRDGSRLRRDRAALSGAHSGISPHDRDDRVRAERWRLFRKYQVPWWCLIVASLGAGRLVSARSTASAHPELKKENDVETGAGIADQSETALGLEQSIIVPNAPPAGLGAVLSETKVFEVPALKSTSLSETEPAGAELAPASVEGGSSRGQRGRGRFGTARVSSLADRPRGPSGLDRGRPELRVLLIGNSYTMHHTLHSLLQRLAASVTEGPQITVDAEAHGGYSLRSHLRSRGALAKIRSGRYTHVVLQGHSLSALDHRAELEADAARFKQAIDAASGHTVFYATWARSPEARIYSKHPAVHSFEQMTQLVSSTYSDISKRLGAGLAPVGRAFERSLVRYPKLALWTADGSHPTLAGSYLAACVLYAAISGTDPRSAEYVPPGMAAGEAAQIREVAAESFGRLKTIRARPTNLATAPL